MVDLEQRNSKPLEELLKLLESGQAILMAGAGCSVDLDYPDWWKLVHTLIQELSLSIQIEDGLDVKVAADLVKKASYEISHERHDPYERKIREIFSPHRNSCGPFQRKLVRLGFAGIVTTNYDPVIENAVMHAYTDKYPSCQPINLCDKSTCYRIQEFLRALGQEPCPYVLHLHGYYDKPDQIVLTQSDYELYYNNSLQEVPQDKHNSSITLDSLHRKTIWALLSIRNVVFVGFSLSDSFFIDVINVWRQDLNLYSERPHFAFIPIKSDFKSNEYLKQTEAKLHSLSVKPIFYEIPENNPSDHSGLHNLIADLAARRNIIATKPDVNTISRRTLEML